MSYLFELIQSLNEKEKRELSKLAVIGKEQQVLDQLLAQNSSDFDIQKSLLEIGISRSHFDKISSVLLYKCFAVFVPKGDKTLLNFLINKGLTNVFMHELKLSEKALLKEKPDLDAQRSFYEYAFRMICRLPARTNGKMVTAKQFATKYLDTISDEIEKSIQEVFTESRLLICLVELEGVTKRMEMRSVAKKIEKDLYGLKQKSILLKDPYATYSANIANLFYYNLVAPDKSLSFLKEGMKVLPLLSHRINESERINFHLKYAECLFYTDKLDEAYHMYGEFFKDEKSHRIITHAQRSKYIQLCIILGKYEEAEAEMKYVYALSSEEQVHSYTLMYALNSIRLYLLTPDYERAFYYLQLMKEKLSKNLLVIYEVEIRNFEAAYFYLIGELEFATKIAKKHLKYFSSKPYLRAEAITPNFCKLLLWAIQKRKKKQPIEFEQNPLIEPFLHRELKFYHKLLLKMATAH